MSLNKVNHLAIIMDGNQRWALLNKKSKLEGYLAGLNNLKLIINKHRDFLKELLKKKYY